eukprot:3406501-Alexandrium_andersonii.AAC.1
MRLQRLRRRTGPNDRCQRVARARRHILKQLCLPPRRAARPTPAQAPPRKAAPPAAVDLQGFAGQMPTAALLL